MPTTLGIDPEGPQEGCISIDLQLRACYVNFVGDVIQNDDGDGHASNVPGVFDVCTPISILM